MTRYVVYDVFTNVPFGGNQLAVFPNASDLLDDKLQKIAAEFNFSEVTFVYPPDDPAHTAKVRIFTPTSEVDFAGHPTIGTAIALSDLGEAASMVLELGIGPVPCIVQSGRASFTVSNDLQRLAEVKISEVAAALGLTDNQIKTNTHDPILASLGLPFVLVELDSVETLSACQPDHAAIRKGAQAYPQSHDFALFAYARNGMSLHSRMFAPLDNIPEDPATGSASATLAALLSEMLGTPQSLTFHQGVDMGRPSLIKAETTLDPLTVTITGQAVQTMAGEFIL